MTKNPPLGGFFLSPWPRGQQVDASEEHHTVQRLHHSEKPEHPKRRYQSGLISLTQAQIRDGETRRPAKQGSEYE
ncbi:MAG: hypothetical protein A2Y72_01625 [Chloroflexi bacterium RBG_13_53_26]|nr:MAG: hypothetical protein A2Y72_01625 [Chloroflexi bacterium RBG_13_53_26]